MHKSLIDCNIRLQVLEDKLIGEAIKLDFELQKRVQDNDDLLDDYEIELLIHFYLKEDDKDYKQDDDNILATLKEYLKGVSKKDDHRWKSNHNDFFHWANHPMQNEQHCWLYHCLYDHVPLSIEDILKIGTIWSDIQVTYQYFDNK